MPRPGAPDGSTWRDIGSNALFGPGVRSWGPDRLDVFAKGRDHQMLHRFGNGQTWSAWLDLGTFGTDDNPAAANPCPPYRPVLPGAVRARRGPPGTWR